MKTLWRSVKSEVSTTVRSSSSSWMRHFRLKEARLAWPKPVWSSGGVTWSFVGDYTDLFGEAYLCPTGWGFPSPRQKTSGLEVGSFLRRTSTFFPASWQSVRCLGWCRKPLSFTLVLLTSVIVVVSTNTMGSCAWSYFHWLRRMPNLLCLVPPVVAVMSRFILVLSNPHVKKYINVQHLPSNLLDSTRNPL